MKRIILTGGGTAGHVTPNIALLPRLKELQYDIHYIGSYNGIEKDLIEPFHIPYHGISSGKLRRYFSMKNFTDPFRVLKGFHEANQLIKALKPDVIFSKGRSCGHGRKTESRPNNHSRVRHHTGTCEQALYAISHKDLLQFPGNFEKSSG